MAAKRKLKLVPIKPERNAVLIDALADLMKDAKAGELQSLAYVGECRDNTIITGATDKKDLGRVIGALARLQLRLCREYDE